MCVYASTHMHQHGYAPTHMDLHTYWHASIVRQTKVVCHSGVLHVCLIGEIWVCITVAMMLYGGLKRLRWCYFLSPLKFLEPGNDQLGCLSNIYHNLNDHHNKLTNVSHSLGFCKCNTLLKKILEEPRVHTREKVGCLTLAHFVYSREWIMHNRIR